MTVQTKKKFLLPLLIVTGIVSCVCLGMIFLILTVPTPASTPPTPDVKAISTYAFETALAMNLQTLEASTATKTPTPTVGLTLTSLPTATQPQTLTPTLVLLDFSAIKGTSCIPKNPPQTGIVVQVVDGDTIKIMLDEDGLTYSVRYIGMDTPENTTKIEYFGPEATAKNTDLVSGEKVMLIKDVSETDRYGRLLRYILTDTVFVNYELVAQGYANTASYPPDISCISTFQAAEQVALASAIGFWAGLRTVAPVPTVVSSAGGSGGSAPCNCGGGDLDCPDFGSHASAQACFDYCRSQGYGDVFRLDRDQDGLACESN